MCSKRFIFCFLGGVPTPICNFFCPFVCLSVCRAQLWFLVHLCKWYVQAFFFLYFFKILIFWVIGVKGQKMAQNDRKLCLSHSISQEAYIVWSWFLVHMCNGLKWQNILSVSLYLRNISSYDCCFWYMCEIMISPSIIFVFSKFWFLCFLGGGGGGGGKKAKNDLNISGTVCRSYHFGT